MTNLYWPTFASGRFPEFQLVLYDEAADTILGRGQTTPVPLGRIARRPA